MKKHLLLLFMITGIFNSCIGQIKQSELIGKWKVVHFEANTPTLSPEIILDAKKEALSSIYQILENNKSILASSYYNRERKGTWKFNEDTQELIFNHDVNSDMGLETSKIIYLTGNMMKWTQDLGELGSITMVLEKLD